MDPEFQRVLFRVLAVGGIMAILGGTGVFLAFRSFGDEASTRRSPRPIVFVLLAFVAVCCLVLLRFSVIQ